MSTNVPKDSARPSAAQEWALIAAMTVSAHPVALVFALALTGVSGFVGEWGLLAAPIGWIAFWLVPAVVQRNQLPGRALRPADEPELAALVRTVADRLGFSTPLLVRLIPIPDAALFATKVAGTRVFVLVLGWPLVRRLTAAQLAAMVAHELAHEQHVVDRRTSWLFAARASLAESLDGGVHVPAALAGKMFRATQSRSWELETAADASSAEVAGGDAVRGALHQSGKITAAFDLLGEKWSSMLAEDDSYPQDLYDALDVALDDPWVVRLAASAAAAADAEDTMDPVAVSTHPPVATRVAAVPAHSGGSWDADRPVPIRTREALDKWCVQELVGPDDPADGMRPVRVLDCAPERFDEPVEEAYQAMVDATGSESVSGAMSAAVDAIAAGKWVKLAQAIDPEIRRAPPALLEAVCREVVVDCLGRAISQRLLDAGWHRASRWTTSVLFSPEGEDFNVAELIELAVDGADPGSFQALGSLRQLVSLADSRAIL